jgi:hypothetical protein
MPPIRTLGRLALNHIGSCLEWETARAAEENGLQKTDLRESLHDDVVRAGRWPGDGPGAGVAAVPSHSSWPCRFLLLWAVAPIVAWWISQPVPAAARRIPGRGKKLMLRAAGAPDHGITSRRFVDATQSLAAAGQLPGTSAQRDGGAPRLRRISALTLLATLSAWDFGYLSKRQLLDRLGLAPSRPWAALERYRGHFYNWYGHAHARNR